MSMIRGAWGLGIALALSTLPLAPVSASTYKPLKRTPQKSAAASAPGFGAFTPASADPRLAAAFARSGLGTRGFADRAFRFTPGGAQAGRRAVTVAVRAHAVPRGESARNLGLIAAALAPETYNLGLAIGWKRFALSGDVARVDGGLAPYGRESADLGLTYAGNRWSTKLDIAAERSVGERPLMLGTDKSYSVGLGGAYSLTRNLAVTGGVRYKLEREQILPLTDNRRDSQAVYLGTAFRF